MNELSFASYCNRFSGQAGWVIGRGPTRFDYAELARGEGPVFFINDAVSQEKWLTPGRPAFFFAHDASMACWLTDPKLRSIPMLIADQPMTGPIENPVPGLIGGADDPRLAEVSQGILYRKDGPLDRISLLSRSRQEIAESGQLYVAGGTIHPLLHFAWYVGCARLQFVGCDGLPETGYEPRLENRSQSKQSNALFIRIQQEEMLQALALPADYLGAIPRRIQMLVELRVRRENHELILRAAELLVTLFRASGCGALAIKDYVPLAGSCWIDGEWPTVQACVGCFASESYKEIGHKVLLPLLGDLRMNRRIAFRTVA